MKRKVAAAVEVVNVYRSQLDVRINEEATTNAARGTTRNFELTNGYAERTEFRMLYTLHGGFRM